MIGKRSDINQMKAILPLSSLNILSRQNIIHPKMARTNIVI
jgi:hypothetical protein